MGICLLLPNRTLAQNSFPRPSTQLHDVKFKPAEPIRAGVASQLLNVDGRTVALPSTPTQINSLSFSQDGKLLAAGKQHGRLVVWDVESKTVVTVVDTGFPAVGRVAISPDNQFIAAAAKWGPSIKLWHIPDGQPASTVDNTHANVLQLMYAQGNRLIVFSGSTDEFDATSGKLVRSFPGERTPVLSSEGNKLVTVKDSNLILRTAPDWTIERTLPKLVSPERPVFWDETQGVFLFQDITDDHVFVAARTSDGQMRPEDKLANLPKSSVPFEDFAAVDPHSGLVFGHSGGELWALDVKTGKTCVSPQLLSNSGALSPDSRLLAGAVEPASPTDNQKEAGVFIWKTEDVAKACHMR
jgi:WD40 repeat protein